MQQQFTAIEIIRHSGNSHNKSCTTYILTPSHIIIIRFNVRLFYVTSSRKSSHNNYKSSQQLQEFTTITRVHNTYKSSQQLQEFTTITRVHKSLWGGVAQWIARLTRDRWIPVSREFEPHQRPPLFPWARNFTLIA